MKANLQKPDDGAYIVPRPGAKARWLQFLIVLLLLAANAGVVKANPFWGDDSQLKRPENTNISGRTLTLYFLTYDTGGSNDSYTEWLDIYFGDEKLFSLTNTKNGDKYGKDRKDHISDMKRSEEYKHGGAWYYLKLTYTIPYRYWGTQKIRYVGKSIDPNKSFDYTITPASNLSSTPAFTNKPSAENGRRVAKDKIQITFTNLPNVNRATNKVTLPNGEVKDVDYYSMTYIYTDNSDPGVAKTLSGMKSEVSFAGKTDTYNMSNYTLPKLPTVKNLKPTYSQTDKNVLVEWEVDRTNSRTSTLDRVVLLRKEKTATTWIQDTVINVSSNSSTYKRTDKSIAFEKEYDYAVVYFQNSSTWGSVPTTLYESGITGLHTTGSVSTTVSHKINLTGDYDLQDGAVLTWNSEKSDIFTPSSFQILRNGRLHKTIAYDINKDSYEYKDESLRDTSITYEYQIKHVVNRTNILVKDFLSNKVSVTGVQSAKIIKTQATKGEYPGIVKLSWDVQNYPMGGTTPRTQYIISRRSLESSNNAFVEIYRTSSNEDFLTYTDDRVLPGIYYEYEFKWIARVNDTDIPGSVTNVGFAQSSGNVSGRISYGTGTSVEGVNVMLKPTNTENDITASRSLRFLGTGSYAKWDLENKTKADSLFIDNDYSMQMWVRPGHRSGGHSLWTAGTESSYLVMGISRLQNSSYMLNVYTANDGLNLIGELYVNEYSHITMVKSGNQYKFYIKHLADDGSGTFITDTKTLTLDSYSNNTNRPNSLSIGRAFAGYLDEFRFWTKALTESEINNNFDRLLAGNEPELYAYWRFDEGLTTMFFDASRKGSVMNGNHGTIVGTGVQSTIIIPSDVQLSLKAITDKDGNYLVSGIPFGGEGTSYSVTPMMGIHKFQPSQSLRFIGANALVHNGTDFTDISSFPVTGKVTFAGGEYPVEGVQLLIDGVAASKNGQLIQTDEKGEFTIDVPIGDHFISVSKNGHTFANKGRFPALESEKHTFVQPENINFQDQTLVKIAGRVSGGEREGTKPLGFGQSIANIGKATVVLNPVDDRYQLNTGTADKVSNGDNASIKSNSVIQSKKTTRQIVIETDETTGEYLAMLPPVEYKVIDVFTKDNNNIAVLSGDDFKINDGAVPPINPDVNRISRDSVTIDGKKQIFEYHNRVDLNYRTKPIIEVTDPIEKIAVFGDKVYNYSDDYGNEEHITLYEINPDKSVTYRVNNYPVFKKLNRYNWSVYAYEKYTNPVTKVIDLVPLAGKELEVNNSLASNVVMLDDNELSHDIENIVLNENGKAVYSFYAGFPNLSNDHLLAAKITYDNEGQVVTWPATGDFKGYVFGDVPVEGTNFVTQGPDAVEYIIRDPSGSNSSAYLEKGAVISNNVSISKLDAHHNVSNAVLKLGGETKVAIGVGVAQVITTETNLDISVDFESTVSTGNSTSVTTSTELQNRISTSDSEDYVGANADVYIGKSTNLLFGKINNLGLYPNKPNPVVNENGKSYSLVNFEEFATGLEFSTTFNYTQNHIIENLIPNFIKLRNQLIRPLSEAGNTNNTNEFMYFSTVPADDENFGNEGYYTKKDPAITPQKPIINKVKQYNQWIKDWEFQIAENERTKIESSTQPPVKNISFDAGTILEESITQRTVTTEAKTFAFETEIGMGFESGFEINKFGFNLFTSQTEIHSQEEENSNETDNSRTFGYVLADGNMGDYYTIDVYDPTDKGGYIFRTRGGQSSCPFEGTEYAKYYEPEKNHILNVGTFQIEKPAIYVNNAKIGTAENISNGREATFELQLSNLSEANRTVTYKLAASNSSNPNGLILSIDGTPLTSPRIYTIPANGTITKTLKVRQSSLDVLDYKNLALLFASTCDVDIVDSVHINVKFVPSSSPLTLKLPTTLINKENGNPKITYQVSDYERNFKNFASIRLQYKNENSQNWSLAHEFVNNKDLVPLTADNTEITGATFSFDFDVKNLPDARYDVRAVAVSKIGTDEITTVTPTQKVIKDVVSPQVLGAPAPVTGILTPEGEISVMFNEDILSSYITDNFITVKGVLNGHKIDHNVAAKFNGSPAYTEASVALADNSFTIEGWLKRTPGEAGTWVAHDNLQIGFTSDDKVTVKIGNETFTSTKTLPTANWQYLSFAYNNETRSFSAYGLYEAVTETLFTGQPVQSTYQGTGRLYVGANVDNSSPFNGSVHNLALWNKTRTLADLSDRDKAKVGNEKGLIGYWSLTEGHGTIATDIARSRQLTLPSTNNWYLNNVNHALDLDGTNSVQIPSGTIPVTEDENFAIELWFNGAEQANATLLSAGDGILDMNVNGKLSIGFNADKKLTLRSKGESFELSNKNLLDGKWHHLALNVVRGGYATVYVNGTLEKQITASNIGAVESGEISLGSNKYFTQGASGVESKNENFFKGKLDEVRIWKSTLSASMFNLNRYNRLVGNETGLAAYYPFERTYVDAITNRNETDATLIGFTEGKVDSATIVKAISYESVNVPPLKEARVTENVNHTFTVSKDKVVINITEPTYRIEGRTLEMELIRVQDLNGNEIKPIKWTAFINLNRLNWSDDAVNVTQEHLSSNTVEVTISNQSGKEENWAISNIPVWLGVSKTQGTLKPLSSEKIVLTFLASAPIGSYEDNIYLTGNNQIEEPLAVSLKVTGTKPNWTFNPDDFETSMNIVGSLKVDGQLSEDKEDILAAFVDGKCVGLASPTYVKNLNTYLVMLNVYGSSAANGKQVEFKVWDASTGKTYPVVNASENIIFTNDAIYGGLYKPVVFDAANLVEQNINLTQGWNWISFNVEHVDMSLQNIFTQVKAQTEFIKDKVSMAVPSATGWAGVIDSLYVGQMYKVKNSAPVRLNYLGKETNPREVGIDVVSGWNWIGYTPQGTMPVTVAMADANPVAGDLIKSKNSFAVYSGTEWIGDLKYLTPGAGYMYQTTVGKRFFYPTNYISRVPLQVAENNDFYYNPSNSNYYGNMNIIAQVQYEDGTVATNMELGAFVGTECRGTEITRNNDLIFLTIAGEDGKDDILSFKVYDKDINREVSVPNIFIKYVNDGLIGSLENPQIITISKTLTGLNDVNTAGISVTPTLVNDKLFVQSENAELKRIVIADINGKVVYTEEKPEMYNEIRVNNLLSGVYFVEIITQANERKVERIVKR
ncbi:MAG: T9SS type A sorting domain-containing protein [Porphyromonadaceae bacterium]|nr:T9SS type A sorting domain-containing protein [Porphyromonadaceae bacterium]